ncbi:MAG: bifunctional salicylyl-CoA 5-hydroxylase/oxidoreductase, partial [Alphaproteobacteria bacterium]|nr:bifunctional salicylyl-CoA 5-hydroxylase/oxidoreductase [Alphaproteobacteria bacterium]
SLLSRSKRVTWDNLRLRDPQFIAACESWFAGQTREAVGHAYDPPAPPMFQPFRLRGLELANRVVVSPMCQYSASDGMPGDWHLVHLGSRAIGGAGLVITEMTDISPEARITEGCAGLWSAAHATAWRRIVDFVHENSAARICVQLAHAGRKGATCLPWAGGYDEPMRQGAWPILSASPLPYLPHSQVPRAMTRADMDQVREDFVRAARLAQDAGFDMIELHMAHGYLLSSFISPLTNRREDEYGGSIANRMRFPIEVFDAVRAVWPAERPISVRVSASDWVEPDGLSAADSVEVARLLKAHGCDIIDVSAGQTVPEARPVYGRMFQTPFSDQIRQEAGIATMAVGNITSADQVNTIVASGRADLVALARPHLADPYFTLHAAAQYGFELQRWPRQYLAGRAQAHALAARAAEEARELRAAAAQPKPLPARRAAE